MNKKKAKKMEDFDLHLKIVVLGESGVGKTSILTQYCKNKFDISLKPTIGVDLVTKIITINGKKISCIIWDTAGQERFQSMENSFYRGSSACVLVYDITNKDSFLKIEHWRQQFILNNNINDDDSNNIPFLLIGNKSDKNDNKIIISNEGKEYANKYGMLFYETSALNKSNINESFNDIINKAKEYHELNIQINSKYDINNIYTNNNINNNNITKSINLNNYNYNNNDYSDDDSYYDDDTYTNNNSCTFCQII